MKETLEKYQIFIINTDAKSLGHISPHNKWFQLESAFTGGDYIKYGRNVLGKLSPGDILIMYANKIGAVGVGKVLEFWDEKIEKQQQQVYRAPYIYDEYSIKVDWFADLRNKPVPGVKLQQANNNRPLNTALISVKEKINISQLLKSYGVQL